MIKEDTKSNPVAKEYLRQALDFESPRPGCLELHGLWEAAPAPTVAPPLFWKVGAKAVHGTDPLEGAEIVDGKVYADPITTLDYVVFIGDLASSFDEFIAEATETSVAEALARNPTTDRAFFAVAGTIAAHIQAGRDLAPIEAINSVIGSVKKWAKESTRLSDQDAEERLLAALFGNEIPQALTSVGD